MRKKKAFQILIIWGLITLLWGIYRFFFQFPECVDELIFKPLIFLSLVGWFVKFKEKRGVRSLGLIKIGLRSLLIGLGLGVLFSLEGVLSSYFKNKELFFNPKGLSTEGLLLMGFLSLLTGFSEEILYRGFLMNRFWKFYGNEFLANFLSSVLFVLSHLPIAILVLDYAGRDLFGYLLLIFVLGVADGFVFGRTKNTLAPTISHALWNWSVFLVR